MILRNSIAFLILGMVACMDDCDSITSPEINRDGGQQIDSETEPEFDPGRQLEIAEVHGFSAFALPTNPVQDQMESLDFAERRGYNTPRVCAETRFWDGTAIFPKGRWGKDGELALQDLKVTLELVASRGMFILLIADCTLKHSNVGAEERERWVRSVGRLARDFDNVFIEAVNEYRHRKSRVDRDEVRNLIRIIRGASGGKLVGTDLFILRKTGMYGYDFGLGSNFASFHVWRALDEVPQDPTRSDFDQMVAQNSGLVVISESVAWGTEADIAIFGNLVTTDKARMQRLSDNCQNDRGCIYFGHTVAGLAGIGYTWLPRRNR